jgi:long-chain fatty acid transport protein
MRASRAAVRLVLAALLPGIAVVPARARGAGFAIYEQGASATGRACAVTAVADRPSALFYNAAGIALLPGLNVEAGDTLIFPLGQHEDPATGRTTDAVSQVFYPPTIYASYLLPGSVALGLGVFAPFGLGMEWPADWIGFTEIESIELQTFFINPTVAWRPFSWLAIGAGFDAVRGTVELRKGIDLVDEHGSLHGAGGAWGFGGNAGILFRFLGGDLSFGASYRSAVKLDFTGDADFSVPPSFASLLEDQPLESSITLPHAVAFGVAGNPFEMLTLSADATLTLWSSFRQFGMRFPGDAERPEDEQLTQFERRDWSDAWSVRFGLEVRPPVAPGLALRAGVVYDTSPSPSDTVSPSLPDADRIDASGGVGYVFPWGLVVDVGYMYVRFLERTTTGDAFPGTYRASAHLLGMSVGYRYFD